MSQETRERPKTSSRHKVVRDSRAWVATRDSSKRMKRIGRSRTSLERRMESVMHSLGMKFRRQPDLLGHPDFRVPGTRVLVFCDSEFWHGRRESERTGRAFRRNRRLWAEKLDANKRRDARITRALRRGGWTVVRVWDSEMALRPKQVCYRLLRALDREGLQ